MHSIKSNLRERRIAIEMLASGKTQAQVARKLGYHERTIRYWVHQFDGTLESLLPKSSRPKTKHPNAHTDAEIEVINKVLAEYPNRPFNELFGILRVEYAYSRHYKTFVKFVHKHCDIEVGDYEKYLAKPYETPTQVGIKCQQDVKCVPKECYQAIYATGERWFQFGIVDEATREAFAYPYKAQNADNSVDFDKRAFVALGYIPAILQTDNGYENTSPNKNKVKVNTKHKLDIYLESINVKHQLIRVYTPRHNGEIERFNRTCHQWFYMSHTGDNQFKSFEDYKQKLKEWVKRYNNNPHSSLRDKTGKQVWFTPYEKRAELEQLYLEQQNNDTGTITLKLAEQTSGGKTIIVERELTLPKVNYIVA